MLTSDRNIGIRTAHETLLRGAAFLGGRRTIGTRLPTSAGVLRAKVIGNSLRELDRFLNILIDEAAAALHVEGIDSAGFAERRNTANKLRTLYGAMGRPSPDHARLRALGRTRDCLFHCAGVVRRADERGGTHMTMGWPPSIGLDDAPLMVAALGETLAITAVDLRRICDFYEQVAAKLMTASGFPAVSVDFRANTAYVDRANVACDGT